MAFQKTHGATYCMPRMFGNQNWHWWSGACQAFPTTSPTSLFTIDAGSSACCTKTINITRCKDRTYSVVVARCLDFLQSCGGNKLQIIGSAEALPILCVRCARWERERERERERDTEREREKDGSDVTIVALKLAMSFTLSLAKNSHFSFLPSHFPSLPF